MKSTIVNFATPNFYFSQKLLNQSAIQNGINCIKSFSKMDIIKTAFYKRNKKILDQKRGAGYWLWKPYIILETLNHVNQGDYVLYSDSGIQIIKDVQILFKLCNKNNGILLFNTSEHKNYTWTKRDCFALMNLDSKKYWYGQQVLASFQLYKKCNNSISFVKEWLNFSQNANIITDLPNISGKKNFDGFKEHRWDQSILSILAIKYNINYYRDPTQWGNYLKLKYLRNKNEFIEKPYSEQSYKNSDYGTLLYHHRNYGIDIKLGRLFYFLKINFLWKILIALYVKIRTQE